MSDNNHHVVPQTLLPHRSKPLIMNGLYPNEAILDSTAVPSLTNGFVILYCIHSNSFHTITTFIPFAVRPNRILIHLAFLSVLLIRSSLHSQPKNPPLHASDSRPTRLRNPSGSSKTRDNSEESLHQSLRRGGSQLVPSQQSGTGTTCASPNTKIVQWTGASAASVGSWAPIPARPVHRRSGMEVQRPGHETLGLGGKARRTCKPF